MSVAARIVQVVVVEVMGKVFLQAGTARHVEAPHHHWAVNPEQCASAIAGIFVL